MRKESLHHASDPCVPLESDLQEGDFYRVESTGAIVTLSSSIGLIYFYCSRLPSDGLVLFALFTFSMLVSCFIHVFSGFDFNRYFKPTPRWDSNTCTLYLPKSCPIPCITVEGNSKKLKQIACLGACKKLHQIGALTDKLVPDIVMEEDHAQELGNPIMESQH